MQPGRYKSRILRFWGMPVAANGESILAQGRPVAFAILWRSRQSRPDGTGVVLLRFPAR